MLCDSGVPMLCDSGVRMLCDCWIKMLCDNKVTMSSVTVGNDVNSEMRALVNKTSGAIAIVSALIY